MPNAMIFYGQCIKSVNRQYLKNNERISVFFISLRQLIPSIKAWQQSLIELIEYSTPPKKQKSLPLQPIIQKPLALPRLCLHVLVAIVLVVQMIIHQKAKVHFQISLSQLMIMATIQSICVKYSLLIQRRIRAVVKINVSCNIIII